MAALLVMLLCSGTPADALVDDAVAAIERFQYDRAVVLLESALAEGAPAKTRVHIHLHLGVVRFTIGDRAGAEDELRTALVLDRTAVLPADTSPKILARFEQLRASLPPTHPPVQIAEPAEVNTERFWTWIAAGVGGVTIAAGSVVAVLSRAAATDASDTRWADDADAANDRAELLSGTATGLFIGGGVVLAAAATLFFLEGSVTATVAPADDGMALGLMGRF